MSGRRWLILADDLTGAADCGIAFAKRGLATVVGWGEAAPGDPTCDAFAFDTNSRALSAPDARARQAAAFARFFVPGSTLYKKIDSTLRGQPAAEIAVLAEALRAATGAAFGIFAPAFPATGRTTRGGRVLVGGAPLEEAEVWRREHSYPSAELVAILATAGLRAATVPLATVRAATETLRAALAALADGGTAVAACDAETEEDLRRIATASLSLAAEGVFFIGSAGLAAALAAVGSAAVARPPLPQQGLAGGTLVVVGSLAAVSRQAAERLAAEAGVLTLPVEPAILLGEAGAPARAALARAVGDGLRAGDTVLVHLLLGDERDLAVDARLVAALADVIAPAAPHIGSLAATGGETAACLLSRLGVNGIRLVEEVEPGIALGLALGPAPGHAAFPVVTKAGAFGGPDSLARIARHLRRLRKEPA